MYIAWRNVPRHRIRRRPVARPRASGHERVVEQLARRPWLVTLVVAAWSIVCHGYRYGVVNHGMQVPLMRMVAGDTCFDHDAFMQTVSRTYTTVFFDGVGVLARFVPLETVCLVL